MILDRDCDRTMHLDYLLTMTANLCVVAVFPVSLGLSGGPFSLFIAYALLAGGILTLAEDVRYARQLFTRADVRDYLAVRIAMVAICGTAPFLLGSALAW